MRLLPFQSLADLGRIPRSHENRTVMLSEIMNDSKIVFISHRWQRHSRGALDECDTTANVWNGKPNPDDCSCRKHKLICMGVERLADMKEWDKTKVFVWIDYACVDQDDQHLMKAAISSCRGYLSVCDAVLIPVVSEQHGHEHNTMELLEADFFHRAWTRLECMGFYAVSIQCFVVFAWSPCALLLQP